MAVHVGDASDDHRPKTVKSILRTYAEETTVHCVKYVAGQGRLLPYRLFWLLTILLALTALLYTVGDQLNAMLKYPSRLRLHVQIKRELMFPSVSICNINIVRKSEVEKQPGMKNFLLSISDLNYLTETDNQVNESIITEEDAEIVRNMGHTLNMTFIVCQWQGERQPCDKIFVPRKSDRGTCFTFNNRINGLSESLIANGNGFSSGLYLLLNVNQSEYVTTVNTGSAGFRVFLHDFNVMPLDNQGFTVSPGFSNVVKIRMREIEFLPSPYKAYDDTECRRSGEKLKYFSEYDTNSCYWECKLDYLTLHCGCKTVFDPGPAPYCNTTGLLDCYVPKEDAFWKNITLMKECPCYPLCSQRLFDSSVSMAYFPSEAYAETVEGLDLLPGGIETYRKNFLELRLQYTDFMYETMVQEPIYTFQSISATLGGQMGLYLGVSVLSAVELLYTIAACVWTVLSKRLSPRRTSPGHEKSEVSFKK